MKPELLQKSFICCKGILARFSKERLKARHLGLLPFIIECYNADKITQKR